MAQHPRRRSSSRLRDIVFISVLEEEKLKHQPTFGIEDKSMTMMFW
jgi:hypothetical protein